VRVNTAIQTLATRHLQLTDFSFPNKSVARTILEPKPGTYALILSCASNARIQVGRLGTMRLQRGYYVYLGSALGPGGLRARIACM